MANDVDKTEHIKHSLELQEDIPLFKRGIHFQRAGIVLMFIFLICGAAGAFGTGPISQQHLTVGTAQIESEKFLRFKDETRTDISHTAGRSRSTDRFSDGIP